MLCSMVADPVAVVRTLGFVVTNAPSPVRKNSITRGGGDDGAPLAAALSGPLGSTPMRSVVSGDVSGWSASTGNACWDGSPRGMCGSVRTSFVPVG